MISVPRCHSTVMRAMRRPQRSSTSTALAPLSRELTVAPDTPGVCAVDSSMPRLGDHGRAAHFFAHALGLFRDFDDRCNQADALLDLGDAQAAGGERAAVERSWHGAAEILHALEH